MRLVREGRRRHGLRLLCGPGEVYRFMKDLEDLDREIIDRLYKAGDLLGISLVDSIIIGNESYHSLREEGEL